MGRRDLGIHPRIDLTGPDEQHGRHSQGGDRDGPSRVFEDLVKRMPPARADSDTNGGEERCTQRQRHGKHRRGQRLAQGLTVPMERSGDQAASAKDGDAEQGQVSADGCAHGLSPSVDTVWSFRTYRTAHQRSIGAI